MNKFILITSAFFSMLINISRAQKPPIDSNTFKNWPSISRSTRPMISSDQHNLLYVIENIPFGDQTTFIKDLTNNSEEKIVSAKNAAFSVDGKKVLYTIKDTLIVASIKNLSISRRFNFKNFRIIDTEKGEFIIIQLKGSNQELLIYNVDRNSQRTYKDIIEYTVSDNEKKLFLKSRCKDSSFDCMSLSVTSILSNSISMLWKGSAIQDFILTNDGNRFAFIVRGNKATGFETEIYLGDVARNEVKKVAGDKYLNDKTQKSLASLIGFNNDCKGMFVKLKVDIATTPNVSRAKVWKTSDRYFNTQTTDDLLIANYNIETKEFIPLQRPGDEISLPSNKKNDTIAFISYRSGDNSEENWNPASKVYFFKINITTGRKYAIDEIPGYSPTGRFMITHHTVSQDLISKDLNSERILNVSQLLSKAPLSEQENGDFVTDLKIEAWLSGDKGVLLSDGYDIWQVDLSGILNPKNLTRGYGFKNHIVFHIARHEFSNGLFTLTSLPIVLNAFNEENKESGFYEMRINDPDNPKVLNMGPYHYFKIPERTEGLVKNRVRLKNLPHLFMINNATRCYNIFFTRDFRRFEQLTDLKPEKTYNWMTSELINYATLNGKPSKAILYKPENFDSSKRYPVIMYYYEKKSDLLNTYLDPGPSNGGMNIPWFVSRGYIVCTPDIQFKIGETGESSYNSVMGITQQLKKLPWIDSLKIGLFGHSFGGYQTNYILTRTKFFAAASSGAGISDLFSFYGAVNSRGFPIAPMLENGQMRIYATPWNDNRNSFIKNSPIFFADKVTTPLLMMANEGDKIVPFAQSVEFFVALRRLGKQAWMIQYKDEDHTISNFENSLDYTNKLTDFFDYYLKNKSRPAWMGSDSSQ